MSEQMLHLMSSTLPAELCSLRHGWLENTTVLLVPWGALSLAV